ncbi:MAG: hypothetical protein QHJ73_09475, partial [Armatimonadota bacterium]|nr:hypothetical protein [Armatimonadota bacterium]
RFAVEMLGLYFGRHPVAFPQVPIGGRLLMEATGLRPGPQLGALMDALQEAVAAGEVRTTHEAISFAREWCATNRG